MTTIAEPPRPKNVRVVRAPLARRLRTAWISDVHLGTRSSNAAALLDFLRDYECETLYVVGDLIDVWQLRRGVYSPHRAARDAPRLLGAPRDQPRADQRVDRDEQARR
jgi:hypothetical protein